MTLEPTNKIWETRTLPMPIGLDVRFETAVVNPDGTVIPLQRGHNEITDWGMDALANSTCASLSTYLHLSSGAGPANRIYTGTGTTVTLAVTDANTIHVTASNAVFQAGDALNTLAITGLQELQILSVTNPQEVVCSTRQGFWLAGSAPTAGPYDAWGIHFTATNTLAIQITKFTGFDTTAANYNHDLVDSPNGRYIHQRVFLSGAVTGADWTIRQLGWSDGGNLVFGKVNLPTPDVVQVGQKYRVTLQVFSACTPIDIASQTVDWGATIGTHDLAVRMEVIPAHNAGQGHFLMPPPHTSYQVQWWTNAFTLMPTKWVGDSGYATTPHTGPAGTVTLGWNETAAYVNNRHTVNRTVKLADTLNLAGVTGVCFTNGICQSLTLKVNSGTLTKPVGYWCALTFPICWTRALTN